ncbi:MULTISPECIES: hypothetical protein [unclassified Frondihabitans]|uniref:hypothetical protein n=1 Tax=unclassified Frondihabitans TaxID=2626248 RepID=UPI000701BF0A|nr:MULTISPECIES: hypothetical protein [unclassified Frondihabitans]KQQ28800.1 hypothetical protein ASF54_09240 [Frondihabitans sp. Leaf304]RPE78173.1 hypothetical protein EDF37_0844 [Frondihabitans sp. PhB153]RPF08454.1 hypothetical protein EDF39_0846 [Frondihabitans sp. PhB161]
MTSSAPSFLRLTGAATTLLFGLFALTHIAVALYGLPQDTVPALTLVALACILLAGYLVTLPAEEPFPLRLTLVVVGLTTLGSLNAWNLPDRGWPGWATWHWGAVSFVLFLLTLRGRPGWTWIGFGIMTGLTIVWSVEVGRGAAAGIGFVIRSAALVLVVWLFSLLLSRTRRAIRRLQRIELSRVRSEAAATAALEEQNTRLEQLRHLATPALERLLSAERITEDDRQAFALVEAGLRDQLRASNLATTRVTDAATRARARGIDVSLLDDRHGAEVSESVRERVESVVVEHLDAATGGRVVARLLPEGRDSVATVLASDGESTTRVAIPEE